MLPYELLSSRTSINKKIKEKEKKRKINNNLAILPSYDRDQFTIYPSVKEQEEDLFRISWNDIPAYVKKTYYYLSTTQQTTLNYLYQMN